MSEPDPSTRDYLEQLVTELVHELRGVFDPATVRDQVFAAWDQLPDASVRQPQDQGSAHVRDERALHPSRRLRRSLRRPGADPLPQRDDLAEVIRDAVKASVIGGLRLCDRSPLDLPTLRSIARRERLRQAAP